MLIDTGSGVMNHCLGIIIFITHSNLVLPYNPAVFMRCFEAYSSAVVSRKPSRKKKVSMAVTLKDYLDRPLDSYCMEILDEWKNFSRIDVPVLTTCMCAREGERGS